MSTFGNYPSLVVYRRAINNRSGTIREPSGEICCGAANHACIRVSTKLERDQFDRVGQLRGENDVARNISGTKLNRFMSNLNPCYLTLLLSQWYYH